ncbi:MAG: YceD family protein [Bacteroidota bacterium]
MKDFKEFAIPFIGLKLGKHQFNFDIDNTFFTLFDYEEFNAANIAVEMELIKKANLLELTFNFKGNVNINCDVTMEPYQQEIDNSLKVVAKFGEAYEEVNEELIILPFGEHQIEVQQYIYEGIVLALPAKRVHPGVEDGTLDSVILDKLEELEPQNNESQSEDDEIDPRWNKLKDLLKD